MKRLISILLVLCMTLSLLPATAWAATEVASGTCGENLTWVLDDEGTLTISGTGPMEDYGWTEAPWYGNWESILSIVIGEGVTTIGSYTFYACVKMTNVTIPDSVATIGHDAFADCYNLSGLIIPNSVTVIGMYSFQNCDSLKSVIIPDSVTTIGDAAFGACSSLEQITIGNGVTEVADSLFANCESLTSVTLPASVTSIGDSAFSGCINLKNVYFGGTERAWNKMVLRGALDEWNEPLGEAVIHFASEDAVKFDGGNGTEEAPYLVSTAAQMNVIREDLVAHYEQTADIDLESMEWIPIGTETVTQELIPFTGSYDGNQYVISNLKISRISDNNVSLGLFGYNEGTLENIVLENTDIQISITETSLDFANLSHAPCIGGIVGENAGTVTNCSNSGSISVFSDCDSDIFVGGIMGFGFCDGCSNRASIVMSGAEGQGYGSSWLYCGGITGFPGAVNQEVYNCVNYGDVNCTIYTYDVSNNMYCGGITGKYGAMINCVNYGRITGTIHSNMNVSGCCNVGGISGYTSAYKTDSMNCINFGNVSAYSSNELTTCYAGGLFGDFAGGISNSYNLAESIHADLAYDEYCYAGRISGTGVEVEGCYSIDTTVVSTPTSANSEQGQSMTEEEIYAAIADILASLGLGDSSDDNIKPEIPFSKAIYHADNLLNDEAINMDDLIRQINEYSPAVPILNNSNVDDWGEAWKEITLFYDTLADGKAYAKYKFEQTDIYETILLSALDCATNDDSAYAWGLSATEKTLNISKNLLERTEELIELKYNWQLATDMELDSMTDQQKAELKLAFEESLNENGFAGAISSLKESADFLDSIMEIATTAVDFVEKTTLYIELWYVSDSMADVLDEMLLKIPETEEFIAMRDAVTFCRDMIYETNREQFKAGALLRANIMTSSKFAVSEGLSFIWGKIRDKAVAANPELAILLIAYKTSHTVTNYLFGADNISEQLYKLKAVNRYISYLESAMLVIRRQYKEDKTEENANVLLNAVSLLHAFATEECNIAYSYAEAVEDTIAHKITGTMGDIIDDICGNTNDNDAKNTLKEYASSLKATIIRNNVDAATHWVNHLQDDFPQYYPEYADLISNDRYEKALVVRITSDYVIECPVDVRVYNCSGSLVVELCDDGTYVLGDVSAIQVGDHKFISIANCDEYYIECDGYAGGTMKVKIREYLGPTLIRHSLFYDLEVSSGTVYDLYTKTDPYDNVIHTINRDDIVIPASFDSGIEKCSVHMYDAPKFEWQADLSCNALFICTSKDNIHTIECPVTSLAIEPTCNKAGEIIYTATAEYNGEIYTNTKTVVTNKAEHDYKDGICTVCGIANPNPFTDVIEGEYYYNPVLWAVDNGITNGLSATRFGVDENCTRAQFVTFLWRAAGSPEPTAASHSFEDVEENQFYSKAVLWAVENGITTGLSATKFGINDPCTRAQVVTFLHRYAGNPEPAITENPFHDAAPGQFYSTAILWAVENGITNGLNATTFGVNNPCSRAQVVTFLYRAIA